LIDFISPPPFSYLKPKEALENLMKHADSFFLAGLVRGNYYFISGNCQAKSQRSMEIIGMEETSGVRKYIFSLRKIFSS